MEILNEERMRQVYGAFYQRSLQAKVDQVGIPEGLRLPAPYAQFWGVTDDLDREHLVTAAPGHVRLNLKEVVGLFDDAMDQWLGGEESYNERLSDAYVAFTAMRMAADFA